MRYCQLHKSVLDTQALGGATAECVYAPREKYSHKSGGGDRAVPLCGLEQTRPLLTFKGEQMFLCCFFGNVQCGKIGSIEPNVTGFEFRFYVRLN